MSPYIPALFSICLSVAAQFCMREGMRRQLPDWLAQLPAAFQLVQPMLRPWVMVGMVLYAAGALVWLRVLAEWDVSKAYPLVGLGFVITLGLGAALGEAVTANRMVGTLLIAAGVGLIGRS